MWFFFLKPYRIFHFFTFHIIPTKKIGKYFISSLVQLIELGNGTALSIEILIVFTISFCHEWGFSDKARKNIVRAFEDFCATLHFVLFF